MWMWSTGINRNIVECKEVIADYPDGNDHVLIETLWNVKLYTGFAMTGVPIRINRNIVECKAHSRFRRV